MAAKSVVRTRREELVLTVSGLVYGLANGCVAMAIGAEAPLAVLTGGIVSFSAMAFLDIAADAPSPRRSWRLGALAAAALLLPLAAVVITGAHQLVGLVRAA